MMKFLDNKYSKWYFSLIKNAQLSNRKKTCEDFFEKHHIIPKSLGGSNRADNLVLLTPREHFVAHLMLVKMLQGSDRKSMIRAVVRMSKFKLINSKRYEFVRKLIAKNSIGEKNACWGKIWINNEMTGDKKLVSIIDFENIFSLYGYKRGLNEQIGGFKSGSKRFINNGDQEALLNAGDELPIGWNFGRLNPRSKKQMADLNKIFKEKGGYVEHSKKMSGRVVVKSPNGSFKRIPEQDLQKYISLGFEEGFIATTLSRPINICGEKYQTLAQAANKLNVAKETVRYRIKSTNPKWSDWTYL